MPEDININTFDDAATGKIREVVQRVLGSWQPLPPGARRLPRPVVLGTGGGSGGGGFVVVDRTIDAATWHNDTALEDHYLAPTAVRLRKLALDSGGHLAPVVLDAGPPVSLEEIDVLWPHPFDLEAPRLGYDTNGDPDEWLALIIPYNTLDSGENVLGMKICSGFSIPEPLAGPSALGATAVSSSQINLAWTINSGDNETGFSIERSEDGTTFAEIDTVAANTTTYSDDDGGGGLDADTTYYYRVRAYDATIYSLPSNTASDTTDAS